MKVYISADIEGVTGLVSWSQCSRPDGSSYDFAFARRMMTHDVNAAIRGARRAGATEVVVKDSHGNSKNLLIDELLPDTQLISGHGGGTEGMMQGIDESFDAALLVGYHGMAGSTAGIMEHTITGGVHRIEVNGIRCGEIGLSTGVAGAHGVPVVMVSSDGVGCTEAVDLIPGVETAVVKFGLGRYMGRLLHPSTTGPLIEETAFRALSHPAPKKPFQWTEPVELVVEFNRSEEADKAAIVSGAVRVDAFTIKVQRKTFREAHQDLWNLISMSAEGIRAQH